MNKTAITRYLVPFLLLSAFITAQFGVSGCIGSLLRRNFWLDEIVTYTIVSDPDLHHAMEGLRGGVNVTPPTFFLLLRAFSGFFGGPGELPLRLFALLSAILALYGLFLCLRPGFGSLVAFTATAAIWAHPTLLRQSFEARNYSLWFAATVWYALCMMPREQGNRMTRILLAVLSALISAILCTVHYFGIVVWLAVTLFSFLAASSPARKTFVFGPALAGPLCFVLVSLPFYYYQKAATLHADYVRPVSAGQLMRVGSELFPPSHIPPIAVILLISLIFLRHSHRDPVGPVVQLRPYAGMASTFLMPPALLIMSLTVQPVMVDRYAIPMLAGLGLLIAWLLSHARRSIIISLLLFFFATAVLGLKSFRASATEKDADTSELIAAIRNLPGDVPVVFEISRDLAVVDHYAPDLRNQCSFLDFEEGQMGGVDKYRLVVRDWARITQHYYGTPVLLPWSSLRTTGRFFLVPGYREPSDMAQIERDYRSFSARPFARNLVELVNNRHSQQEQE